jgi:hypothetical protein
MASELVKKDQNLPTSIDDDGFEGWTDSIEGSDRPQNAGLIKGELLKFSNDGIWKTRDGELVDTNIEHVAYGVVRVVQKWRDQKPIETIVLEPHQKFPNVKKMNDDTPREEWSEGPGGLRGPWQAQHFLYTFDPKKLSWSTFPCGTIGGAIAFEQLCTRTNLMRRVRGQGVYAVIKLSRTWWNVRGGRWRPHFQIERWVRFDGDGTSDVEALPKAKAETIAEAAPPPPPIEEVEPVSLAEEMNDEMPLFDESETKPAAPRPTARRDIKPTAKAKSPPTRRRA